MKESGQMRMVSGNPRMKMDFSAVLYCAETHMLAAVATHVSKKHLDKLLFIISYFFVSSGTQGSKIFSIQNCK
jgi:hypothetical protein